jgi:hypothetical protein
MVKEAENRSRNRPKLDGKVLGYVAWKKDWVHHHKEVYPSLKVEHRKRVLMDKCASKNIKEKISYKRTMELVWKYLDNAFVRSDTYLHDLMQPVNTARAAPEKD